MLIRLFQVGPTEGHPHSCRLLPQTPTRATPPPPPASRRLLPNPRHTASSLRPLHHHKATPLRVGARPGGHRWLFVVAFPSTAPALDPAVSPRSPATATSTTERLKESVPRRLCAQPFRPEKPLAMTQQSWTPTLFIVFATILEMPLYLEVHIPEDTRRWERLACHHVFIEIGR
jgi:hypothetical protein